MQQDILENARTVRKINRDLRRHIYAKQTSPSSLDMCGLPIGIESTNKSQKPPIKIGEVVEDKVQPEAMRLMVVPIKSMAPSNNISDRAFESMGDQIPDTLDFQHERNYTGAQALEMIKNIDKPSDSANDSCAKFF